MALHNIKMHHDLNTNLNRKKNTYPYSIKSANYLGCNSKINCKEWKKLFSRSQVSFFQRILGNWKFCSDRKKVLTINRQEFMFKFRKIGMRKGKLTGSLKWEISLQFDHLFGYFYYLRNVLACWPIQRHYNIIFFEVF